MIVRLRPIALIAVLLLLWQFAVTRQPTHILPTPWGVATGIGELLQHGLLLKYVVASLFRVTWGFALAVLLVGIVLVGVIPLIRVVLVGHGPAPRAGTRVAASRAKREVGGTVPCLPAL